MENQQADMFAHEAFHIGHLCTKNKNIDRDAQLYASSYYALYVNFMLKELCNAQVSDGSSYGYLCVMCFPNFLLKKYHVEA